nr:glycoside hydrolase family 3 protein [Rhodovulum imhoffii]
MSVEEAAFFADLRPFGFILFARNIETPGQVRRLTSDLRTVAGHEAPILIDQEGGRVQRMGPPHWRAWLPALEQALAAGQQAARVLYLRNRLIAAELRAVGLDVNCAPLADVARPETHKILKNRCYGFDAATVIAGARATAEGLLAGGVLPVLKHIPGHGRAVVDSHLDLPRVSAPRSALEEDFAPFRALADLPMAMTAHIVFDAIDPCAPVTVSPAGIRLIREEIGFDGLLMSDDLSMEALRGSLAVRTRAALDAGCDVVLHCNGNLNEMQQIAAEAGPLQADAVRRAYNALDRRQPVDDADLGQMEAELCAILRPHAHG